MTTENTDFTAETRDVANLRLAWEHTFYAFGLVGPFGSYPHYSRYILAPRSVLLILRSLLTSHTALLGQPTDSELIQRTTTCAEQLPIFLEMDPVANQTETTIPSKSHATAEQRAEIYQQIKNNYFWGIGDTLGFLAAALMATKRPAPISYSEIASVAYEASYELLAGHPDRTRFLAWLDTGSDHSRTVSSQNPNKHQVLDYLGSEKEWSFWREWYQGFLDGKPLDWELQRRVALIPDEDWKKGPEHIAGKIEEIKAAYLAEQLPLVEDLAFDQDNGTFHTVPREMAKPDLLGATLSQVEDALEDVMESCSNGINERSVECRKLTRTFRKYGNDPQRIEMDFTTVHAGLTRQIISGELPPSEENLALQSALEEGAKAVRAAHPEVAENRRILQEQSLRELTPDEKATLEEALPVLQAISDPALAEEWAQDIPALTNDNLLPVPNTAPRLPGADEATRIFGRAARMAVLMKKSSDIIHKIDGSAGYKATRILTTLSALVGIGIAIVSVF